MSNELLKEYVVSIINEATRSGREHFSMSSYAGVPVHSEFMNTFVRPFTDAFNTAVATTSILGRESIGALQGLISRILYGILPDVVAQRIVPRVDEIIRAQEARVKSIKTKYADIFARNTDALFSGDAAMFVFLAEPAAYLARIGVDRAPAAVDAMFQSIVNRPELQSPNIRSGIYNILAHLDAIERAKIKHEGVVNRRESTVDDHIAAIRTILQTPRITDALQAVFDAPHREVVTSLVAMENELVHDVNNVVHDNNNDLMQVFRQQLIATNKIDDDNVNVLEPALKHAIQAGLRDAYINVLKKRIMKVSSNYQRIFEKVLAKM